MSIVLRGYEIPEYGRTAKGLPVVNLLKLDEGESIQTIINVESERSDDAYLFFTTRAGIVKRTSVKEICQYPTKWSQSLKSEKMRMS